MGLRIKRKAKRCLQRPEVSTNDNGRKSLSRGYLIDSSKSFSPGSVNLSEDKRESFADVLLHLKRLACEREEALQQNVTKSSLDEDYASLLDELSSRTSHRNSYDDSIKGLERFKIDVANNRDPEGSININVETKFNITSDEINSLSESSNVIPFPVSNDEYSSTSSGSGNSEKYSKDYLKSALNKLQVHQENRNSTDSVVESLEHIKSLEIFTAMKLVDNDIVVPEEQHDTTQKGIALSLLK